MAQQTILGKGIPNLYLEKDYNGRDGWCIRVETVVPIKNEDEVRKWLDGSPPKYNELVNSLLEQVPDGGDQFGARHMVAAAFGFELAEDGRSIGQRRVKPAAKDREVETVRRA